MELVMRLSGSFKSLAVGVLLLLLLSSCGGGDEVDVDDAPPLGALNGVPSVPPDRTLVKLRSGHYDWAGKGRNYSYSKRNSVITFRVDGVRLQVNVQGDEVWWGTFKVPDSDGRFKPGTYANVYDVPFFEPRAGMKWGHACTSVVSSFRIHSVTYINSKLAGIDISFEQRCDGSPDQLYGRVVWSATDDTEAPKPTPPSPDLWRPPEGVVPATGTFVYLQSEWYDFIGKGAHHLYTRKTADIKLEQVERGRIRVRVNGFEWWDAEFRAMNSVPRLVRGYYGPLSAFFFNNPARASMDWGGEHRGCNQVEGWFVVDDVEYAGAEIIRLDMRFEQHCEGAEGALRGQFRWDASDTSKPAGPVSAPDTLWSPAPGVTPPSGNYVYLESDPGDRAGAGLVNAYQSGIQIHEVGAKLSVYVNGDIPLASGEFRGMSSIPRLRVGFYPDAQWTTSANPASPALNWHVSSGCYWSIGWFVIDKIRRDGSGALTAFDARFQQYCEGGWASLRGQVHWVKP